MASSATRFAHSSPVPIDSRRPALSLCGVTKRYRVRGRPVLTALDFVDLDIESGEFAMITGRSGCGKTTLLNVAAGLAPPTSGKVLVNGADIGGLSDAQRTRLRAERIGFVFQFPSLVPGLSVLDNVLLPVRIAGRKAEGAATERAAGLLETVGLADKTRALPFQLSAGQQQRAVVARALIREPAIVIADEPTSSLDELTESEIMSVFSRLNRDTGVTVLMVTHSSSLVEYATRHIRMGSATILSETAVSPPDAFYSI